MTIKHREQSLEEITTQFNELMGQLDDEIYNSWPTKEDMP